MSLRFPAADELLAQACAATGLRDCGTGYREGLDALLDAIRSDIRLTEENLPRLAGPIVALLISRLHSEQGWKERPDCLARTIRTPLVVTGIPRTGTTALHKLLSMDPQFQGLEQWLIATPAPRPPRERWAEDARFRAAVAAQEAFLAAVPELRVSHEVKADEVDECLNLLAQSFVSHYPATGMILPSYDRWWRGRDETPGYRRYADNLRLIGADSGERWLLKNPGTLAQLDALFAVFPDACVIQTHRDPAKAIPSVCSVIWPAACFFQARRVDPARIGPRELDLWAWSAQRAREARKRHGERFLDVQHADFRRDPMATVHAIYERFGLRLDAGAERAMRAWIAANPEGKHGAHEYTLEQFGLTEAMVRERFDGLA